jgi:hypothetical protein
VSSITLKQSLVEDEMKTLKQKCKLLEGKNSRLHGKIANLTQNIDIYSFFDSFQLPDGTRHFKMLFTVATGTTTLVQGIV